MSDLTEFVQIDSVSNSDEKNLPAFWLKPLFAEWENSRGYFDWETTGEDRKIFATLPFGRCDLSFDVDEQDANALHVSIDFTIKQSVMLHCLELRHRTRFEKPDLTWVPHLRPGAELVIADQAFRSPGLLIGEKEKYAALVPDLALWPQGTRSWLDFQRYGPGGVPLACFGLGHFKPSGHIFFKRMKAKTPLRSGTKLQAGYYVLLMSDETKEPLEKLASFSWSRFAPIEKIEPQVLAFKEYQEHACKRIFAPDLYHEFDYKKKPVAGMITQTFTAKRRPSVLNHKGVEQYIKRQGLFVEVLRWIQAKMFTTAFGYKMLTRALHSGLLQIAPMVSFQSWFNQVRTALGSAFHAKRIGDDALLAKTEKIIELALSAETENGCLPAVCFFTEKDVFWIRGTKAFELIDSFHLPDAAVTGFHLLEWYQYIKQDERILDRCKDLAQFFLSLQDSEGAFPTWAKPGKDGPVADELLKQCASAAAPAMLLARLYRFVPEKQYMEAAKRVLAFIEQNVLPEDKWFDYELFFSCAGRPTGEEGPDPYTGCYPANTLSMYWAARAALDVYTATKEAETLALARTILARLSLYQQVFDHPHVSINTFGGFGVMNADGEFNDARQGLFVPLYLDFYRETKEDEFLQRAVAALRSCYTTMLIEEHREVAPGNLVNFRPADRGSVLENYAHTGRDEMTAGYLSPDWGCGTSLYASGITFQEKGQVYVDVKNKKAYGIDLCQAQVEKIKAGEITLTVDLPHPADLEIVVENESKKIKAVVVNGKEAKATSDDKRRYQVSL